MLGLSFLSFPLSHSPIYLFIFLTVQDIPRLYRLGLDLDTLDESEESSVGWVKVYRVNGVLAMSRSIGDLLIKDLKNQTFDTEFTGELVLAEPEVTITKLEPETDRFVVAATDGLWDVMTSQEVPTFVAFSFCLFAF